MLSQEAFVPGYGQRFGFSLASLAASVCARTVLPRVALHGCGGVHLGLIYAGVHGGEFEPVPPGGYPWFAFAVAARAVVHVAGPVALEFGLEGTAAPRPWRFVIEHTTGTPATRTLEVVFEQPAIGLVAHVGLGVSVP
jgi:hypothetical protein